MKRLPIACLAITAASAALGGVVSGCSSDDAVVLTVSDDAASGPDAMRPAPHVPKPDVVVIPPESGGAETGARETGAGVDARPDGAVTTYPIGLGCTKDTDCAAGLTCLKTSDKYATGGGGPAGGYCTKECTPDGNDAGALIAAQELCSSIGQGTLCIQVDEATRKSYCFEQCLVGLLPSGFSKCGDRTDVGCAPTTVRGVDFCAPTCGSDADCAGRVCDIGTGYCVDTPPAGAPIGTACGPGSDLEKSGGQCAGFCFSIPKPGSATPLSFCSGQCVLGQSGCGTSVSDSGAAIPGPGTCAIAFNYNANFDLGYCAQSCDCDGDCLAPDTVCAKLPGQALPGERYGACLPIFWGNPLPGRKCGDAGADAAPGGDGGTRDAGADAAPSGDGGPRDAGPG